MEIYHLSLGLSYTEAVHNSTLEAFNNWLTAGFLKYFWNCFYALLFYITPLNFCLTNW